MQIISVVSLKGGTGKSTTAAALVQAAAASGVPALLIDLDPQGNSSYFIGTDPDRPGAYQLITGAADAGQLIQHTQQGVDVIAAAPDLATLRTTPGSAKRLQGALLPIKDKYPLAVIDTPPQMGELTFNALQACTGVLIPIETDSSGLQGLYQVLDMAQHIQQNSNPDLSIIGAILTRYDNRPRFNRYIRDAVKDAVAAAGVPYLGEIRAGVAVREAQGLQRSLFEYAPKSKPAVDYMELYNRII